MATIHIPESEAVANPRALFDRVRAGDEVLIEDGSRVIAVMRQWKPHGRTIQECIALLPADSDAIMDEDFARDVAAAIEAHREPLDSSAWD